MFSFVSLWCKNRILNKKKLIGCFILITLVVAVLVSALIFSNSMMDGITNKYINLSTGHLSVPCHQVDEIKLNEQYIEYANSTVSGYVLLYSSTGNTSLSIKGVDDDYFNQARLSQINIKKSELSDNQNNLTGIIISETTAKQLNVNLGDKVAMLVVPDSNTTLLRPVIVYVSEIFSTGYSNLDKLIAFTSLEYGKLLFPNKNSLNTEIVLKSEYQNLTNKIAFEIFENNNTLVNTWDELNYQIYQNFISSKQMIFVVLIVVSFVAAFYVSSIAQQLLNDDLKELALLKLIGCNNKTISKLEFNSVYLITVMGIILGTILGILISYLLTPILKLLSKLSISSLSYYLLDFKISIPFLSIILILSILALISLLTIRIALRKTKNIEPIQLFNEL